MSQKDGAPQIAFIENVPFFRHFFFLVGILFTHKIKISCKYFFFLNTEYPEKSWNYDIKSRNYPKTFICSLAETSFLTIAIFFLFFFFGQFFISHSLHFSTPEY